MVGQFAENQKKKIHWQSVGSGSETDLKENPYLRLDPILRKSRIQISTGNSSEFSRSNFRIRIIYVSWTWVLWYDPTHYQINCKELRIFFECKAPNNLLNHAFYHNLKTKYSCDTVCHLVIDILREWQFMHW